VESFINAAAYSPSPESAAMFIQTEETPNPATLKFLPGRAVLSEGSADFRDATAGTAASPLAGTLFALGGVKGVFLAKDFITVTKTDDKDWPALKPLILSAIMDHFVAGKPVMHDNAAASASQTAASTADSADSEIVQQIKEILDHKVRPAVAQDGGDIIFQSFDAGVVYLRLQGSCAGCPSSTATLKVGIENMLKHYIPEVTEVRQVR
jgi:Fe-S cluster biogenesis protein NfuA